MRLSEVELETVRDGSSVLRIWRPVRGMLITLGEGTMTDRFAMAIEDAIERQVGADGSTILFDDWELMTDYQITARLRLTRLGIRFLREIEEGHVLVRERSVLLGVKMSAVVLRGKLRAYTSRPEYERVLEEKLDARGWRMDEATTLPPPPVRQD